MPERKTKMNYVKSKKGGRLFSLFMVLAMVLTSVPAALLASADEVYADTITVKLNVDDKEYIYGGSGVSHYFTATVNGKTRPAYCLQPHLVAPDSGNRKAAEIADSNRVSQTMYYCYGYPGQKKFASWLKNNGYGDHASGMNFYTPYASKGGSRMRATYMLRL